MVNPVFFLLGSKIVPKFFNSFLKPQLSEQKSECSLVKINVYLGVKASICLGKIPSMFFLVVKSLSSGKIAEQLPSSLNRRASSSFSFSIVQGSGRCQRSTQTTRWTFNARLAEPIRRPVAWFKGPIEEWNCYKIP